MKPILLAILAGLCWGVGEIFTKMALNTGRVGPMTIVLIRACIVLPPALAAYFIAAHFWKTEPPNWIKNAGPSVWAMLIIGSGLMAGFLGVFFFYWGLAQPGGDISRLRPIAFGLAPATAVLLGWIMLGEAMTLRKAFAVILIIAGIALLTGKGGHGPAHTTPGDIAEPGAK